VEKFVDYSRKAAGKKLLNPLVKIPSSLVGCVSSFPSIKLCKSEWGSRGGLFWLPEADGSPAFHNPA
jgi:hypothetical protein